MKKIYLLLLMTVITIPLFSQINQFNVGDTLTVRNSTGLYYKPNTLGYSGLELNNGEAIVLIDIDTEKKFYKVIAVNDRNEYYVSKKVTLIPLDEDQKEKANQAELNFKYGISSTSVTAGNELIKFTNHYYAGTLMLIGGASISIWNASNENAKELNYLSIGISTLGLIFTLESFSHCKKAGIILNENGVGVKIPIK